MSKFLHKNMFLLIAFLYVSSTALWAQSTPPSGTPYITITVPNNATIGIDMLAAEDNTPAWVETAPGTFTTLTLGAVWTGSTEYTATGNTIKVYGSIQEFDCQDNEENIIGLAFSGNLSGITKFWCNNNEISTLDITTLSGITKFWCYDNQLTDFKVNGLTHLKELYCHNNLLPNLEVSTLTNLEILYCGVNQINTLEVGNLTHLQKLHCYTNQLSSIDVSTLSNLIEFSCADNLIEHLEVSNLTNLVKLACYGNQLSTLDVRALTKLEKLFCLDNQLTDLNLSGLTHLKLLNCHNNQLTALDVSTLSSLGRLYCSDNNLSTQAIDLIYCALAERETEDEGIIEPIYSASSANYDIVMASNTQNALGKNWFVQYYEDDSAMPSTIGTYVCEDGVDEDAVINSIAVYPNPAEDVLNLKVEDMTNIKHIAIFDITGRLVLRQELTGNNIAIKVSALERGVYMLKVGNMVKSIVKK